jgi:hypothetical protein
MDVEDILKQAESLVFAKTGKQLEHLQKTVLKGTLQGQTYPEIAKENGFSESHVKNVGHELWHTLSSALGEKVTKSKFKSVFKSLNKSNSNKISLPTISVVCHTNPTINNINIFTDQERSPAPAQTSPDTPPEPQINLDNAPAILTCYSRATELNTLEHWIVQDRCRIVQILGISGIGKTALSLRLIDQIKINFDYIIYQTLCFSPILETTLTNLLENFGKPTGIPQQLEGKISQLLKYLRQHRCLIILDDVQMLFSPGKLAGEYQASLENYPLFFKRIAETEHHSCFLLISAEQLQEFTQLKKGDRSVRSFLLGGLGIAAKEILKEYELSDENQWEKLINLYQGNPLWLEMTAMMIQDLFAGNVAEFLEYRSLIICDALKAAIQRQWQRLTPQEQAILIQFTALDAPVSLPQLGQKLNLADSDLLNGVKSLRRRLFLADIQREKQRLFQLNPVYQQYLKEQNPEICERS